MKNPNKGAVKVDKDFIPIAAWYNGGRTRATMVRLPGPDAPREWRKDLQCIVDCGFNAVRCWVDWATAEPEPSDYHFETVDLLLDLAEEVGLRVIVQLYLDSAPDWLIKYLSRLQLRLGRRRADRVSGRTRLLLRPPRRARGGGKIHAEIGGTHYSPQAVPGMGFVERAAHCAVGLFRFFAPARHVLLLPVHGAALP